MTASTYLTFQNVCKHPIHYLCFSINFYVAIPSSMAFWFTFLWRRNGFQKRKAATSRDSIIGWNSLC